MRILILGGTEFVGRALAEEALARGWEVTVFHRGTHPAPAGARSLHGDRTAPGGLCALDAGTWDFVLDTWSGAPCAVRDSARLLRDRVRHYAYVSSRSVYRYPAPAGLAEDGPLVEASSGAGEVDYPQAKRGGELALLEALGPERSLLVRAGLIIGPYENIGRLPWWLTWMAEGGPVLAPGPAELPIQYIDGRDLAIWTLDALLHGRAGAYNLASPPGHATMGDLLDACREVTGAGAQLRWVDAEALAEAGIEPWTELPIWLPEGASYDYFHCGDVTKARSDGLRCRPVQDTVADTWRWLTGIGGAAPQRPDQRPPGLDRAREREFLRAL
ncbi:NAD-dependent epimerase/dehydratase family protein [Streptomyces sp. NPDC006879]|uniref:NAD-dependent epimerase/dehydratase family protein n=1 Tax=Streptomyces sp. NPDC006879 TaxID=3364767 RepID=UPI0036B0454D